MTIRRSKEKRNVPDHGAPTSSLSVLGRRVFGRELVQKWRFCSKCRGESRIAPCVNQSLTVVCLLSYYPLSRRRQYPFTRIPSEGRKSRAGIWTKPIRSYICTTLASPPSYVSPIVLLPCGCTPHTLIHQSGSNSLSTYSGHHCQQAHLRHRCIDLYSIIGIRERWVEQDTADNTRNSTATRCSTGPFSLSVANTCRQ